MTTVEQFTSGERIGVDVQAIERELGSLWREATSDGRQSVTRACLWNVVVRGNGEGFDRACALAQASVSLVPARLLLVRLEPAGGGPEIETWVSANCHLAPGGGKLLCSEEIWMVARGDGARHVPALLRALAVPDVPICVLGLGGVDPRAASDLGVDADRVVVDTGDCEGGRDLEALVRLAHATRANGTRLADLGWLRLGPFRLLLAALFDPPVGAEPLQRLSTVRLRASRHGAATAALLVGWLASRLGWGTARPRGAVGPNGGTWTLSHGRGELALEIEVADGDAGRDGIYELAMETSAGERFGIADAGPRAIRIEATGLPARVVAAPERPDAELLAIALGRRGHDPLLATALARAAELVA
jgi:glucose-6-phosphate dehydrogenase assembly protein OpcA